MPHPATASRRALVLAFVVLLGLVLWPAAGVRADWSGDPADVDPGTPDATLAGRIAVRDGGSVEGGKITASRLDSPDGITWGYDAEADDTGAWSVEVPAGRYRLQAESRFGLQTGWPDLPPSLGTAPVVVRTGEKRDDLDFSMRLRLPQAADDEYGWLHGGWDDDAFGHVKNPVPYPRDTYRSVTAVRGPVAELGGPRPPTQFTTTYPDTREFRFDPEVGGVRFEYDLTNSGDGVLWTGDVRIEGAPGDFTSCGLPPFVRCSDQWIAPGQTATYPAGVDTRGMTGPRTVTLVIPNNAGPEIRVPIRLVPADPPTAAAVPTSRATPAPAAAATAAKTPPSWASSLQAAVVRRASVRLRFPAAGRVVVRIDRPVRPKARGASRWRTARTVRLKAAHSGPRSARMARLPKGRYRIRLDATAASGGRERVTALRSVRR